VPTPPPDKAFLEILPEVPAASREFSPADTLALFTDVYDNRLSTPHRVAITTSVTADAGRVVFNSSDERRSEEMQGKSGGFTHRLEIPLAGFSAGRYVLRVEARMMLSEPSVVARELEFTVR
jgi:hypothetical protein